MTDEAGFLAHIAANPQDRVARLAFSDWLEEQDDFVCTIKAHYLRVDDAIHELPEKDEGRARLIRKLRKLAKGLETEWKARVARVQIEKCPPMFNFLCPQKWENLEPTEFIDKRFCQACQKHVHYCDDTEKAREYVIQEECVAIDLKVLRRMNDLEPIFEGDFDGMLVGDFGPPGSS